MGALNLVADCAPRLPAEPAERRASPRTRVDESGLIAVDEHTSLACLIYDLSEHGVRLVSLDPACVPEVFVLAARPFAEPRVCRVVWRGAEEIGARFAAP
ncbi:hypothetical protein GCM10007886_00440 [Methylobacterium gregans]|uniref:PilZ domain-containing protein n=1 Tax=Methylobacterium gregans TaxID=374424 RepID=A0AA37MBU7_9HYPH|nr:PilZ domain-containing protein [Methylobacterium gregans]MDQ0522100.1 hypothetical protein [Methylobacterium gregans]GJD80417.1 hypothetical protein NBEOAGPD_3658 [Methylobacterium gregans]GLS51862.1 hypothetical protein GCM10007886_00440 [Methylobacterium gregans]